MKPTPALPRPAPVDGETATAIARYADTRRLIRLAAWSIGAGFGGFLLWAALAPLDEGVPTAGTVAVDTKRKAVAHLQGGIVREVLVREGATVEANQVVLRLEDAVARANYEAARQRYLALRAAEGRLLAEQLDLPAIGFHPDLIAAAAKDPIVNEHMAGQRQLLQSRRASLAASLAALDEASKGQLGQIEAYRSVLASRAAQSALLARELSGMRDLVAEGYAPLVKQLELERALADLAATSADVNGSIARAQGAILETRARAQALRSDYRKETDRELAEVRREVQAEGERFRAASEDLARTEIRAPATGQVVGLAVQTVGGVVQAGQKLMDIVPRDEALLLEVQVAPSLIDRVRSGLPVDVRFSTFAHAPQLVVAGVVDSISADILTDPAGKYSYYLARVSITPEGIRALGPHQLQPGMPVEVVIKTGERSFLTYLLHPLLRRLSASMKEQ